MKHYFEKKRKKTKKNLLLILVSCLKIYSLTGCEDGTAVVKLIKKKREIIKTARVIAH